MARREPDDQAKIPEDEVAPKVWVKVPKGRDCAPAMGEIACVDVGDVDRGRPEVEGGSGKGNTGKVLLCRPVQEVVLGEGPILIIELGSPDLKCTCKSGKGGGKGDGGKGGKTHGWRGQLPSSRPCSPGACLPPCGGHIPGFRDAGRRREWREGGRRGTDQGASAEGVSHIQELEVSPGLWIPGLLCPSYQLLCSSEGSLSCLCNLQLPRLRVTCSANKAANDEPVGVHKRVGGTAKVSGELSWRGVLGGLTRPSTEKVSGLAVLSRDRMSGAPPVCTHVLCP